LRLATVMLKYLPQSVCGLVSCSNPLYTCKSELVDLQDQIHVYNHFYTEIT